MVIDLKMFFDMFDGFVKMDFIAFIVGQLYRISYFWLASVKYHYAKHFLICIVISTTFFLSFFISFCIIS